MLMGRVKRITFRSSESGYSVLKVLPLSEKAKEGILVEEKEADRLVTVVGVLPRLEVGDEVEFSGEWGHHPKYGRNFKVSGYEVVIPTTPEGIKRFLASNHIKGVGKVLAERIVEEFKDEVVRVLSEEPQQLVKIKGITLSKAKEIGRQWEKAAMVRRQMIALQGLGLTSSLAAKIIQTYGRGAVRKVKENPYRLAADIWGVGFKRADEIAGRMGITRFDPRRVRSGITYALTKAWEEGHLYLPHDELVEKAVQLLGVTPKQVGVQIEVLINTGALLREGEAIYLKFNYRLESDLADQIKLIGSSKLDNSRLKRFGPGRLSEQDWEKLFVWVAQRQGFELNEGQRQAVRTALTTPLSILTGGPGTGKSTTVRALVEIAQSNNIRLMLTSPTGRAAKRLSELTGKEAFTIHRLLKWRPGSAAGYNRTNPLPVDLLVVDEASMLDALLAKKLFEAVRPGTHVLLVGDVDQLPSVQAGNVLRDLIESNTVAVVKLTEIFRQARESAIVRNAHRINRGLSLEFPPHPTDFYFFSVEKIEDVRSCILDLVSRRIPREFGFDPLEEVQVLSPMYKTAAGVAQLNRDLQQILNPSSLVEGKTRRLGVGDKVLQLVNNYEKEVFNGEIGRVVAGKQQKLRVRFEEREVEYKGSQLDQLTLAYAISVHKAQGSEYPVVVMPLVTAHYIMLQRNLLYTAVTRAKKLVVLVGSKRALYMALKNDQPTQRYSKLKQRLMGVS